MSDENSGSGAETEPEILLESDKNEEESGSSEGEVEKWDAKVVSEIHTFLVSVPDVKPLLKSTNRVAKLIFSIPKQLQEQKIRLKTSTEEEKRTLEVDKDGDLVLQRRGNQNEDLSLFIEYENATSLDQVGLQVWRGALLLADFIIHSAQTFFQNKTILEFGSGTGLSSIVASKFARKVIATDLNDSNILRLIETNVKHNKEEHVRSEFLVEALDFKNLSWSPEMKACIEEADVLLAADVVYHEKITEAFVKTLQKCLDTGKKTKNVFIALEKRYVFSISDLDTVAPMYEGFMGQLESVFGLSLHSFPAGTGITSTTVESSCSEKEIEPPPSTTAFVISTAGESKTRLSMRPVHLDFPQYFNYERTKELVLWNIRSEI